MALEGDYTKPLKNALGNSIVSNADDYFVDATRHNPSSRTHNKFRLSDLPNIDSSSEEELGMRTKMMAPPPPDDSINGNNNEADEPQPQQDESHQPV